MDLLKILTSPLMFLINAIDNGKFFKRPMCIFYIICGVVAALTPLYVIYQAYDNGVGKLLKRAYGYEKVVAVILFVLFILCMILLAVYGFMFWLNRSKQLDGLVRHGDKIVAMPTFGHYLQTVAECFGMIVMYVVTFGACLFFLFVLLTGTFKEFGGFFQVVGITVGAIIVAGLLAYLLILFGHVCGEMYRVKAIVGNNVSDMGDILRAATMPQVPQPVAPKPVAPAPKPETEE